MLFGAPAFQGTNLKKGFTVDLTDYIRKSRSHNVLIWSGMFIDKWYCRECYNKEFM